MKVKIERKFLKDFKGSTKDRKAAAALGNPILMNIYSALFEKHNIAIAQALLERQHFSKRKQFLQLRETIETLWDNNAIPIANENDVVNDLELRFSDNDHLATLLAAGFGAKKLLIATAVEGVLDRENKVIRKAEKASELIKKYVRKETSSLGLGGMSTKLSYASLATQLGIDVTIFGLQDADAVLKAEKTEIGTFFPSIKTMPNMRKKWIGSGSVSMSAIEVDKGAKKALKGRKSLLQVGIKSFSSDFTKGEILDIQHDGKTFAVGIARLSSKEILDLNKKNVIVCHTDDIVLI